jgi:hypothetical protein
VRATVFRTLAGVLAVLFIVVLGFGNLEEWSLRQRAGCWIMAIGFGLYAALGADAERLLALMLGFRDQRAQEVGVKARPNGPDPRSNGENPSS